MLYVDMLGGCSLLDWQRGNQPKPLYTGSFPLSPTDPQGVPDIANTPRRHNAVGVCLRLRLAFLACLALTQRLSSLLV